MRKKFIEKAKKTLVKFLAVALVASSFSFAGNIGPFATLTVEAASEWDSSTVYLQGDRVTYKGALYEAQWWTQGVTPEDGLATGEWKLISAAETTTEANQGNTGNTGNSGNTGGATEKLNPIVGTNIQGITLPSTYYNKKVVGYFPNYAIDSDAHEHFTIADLQWDVLTHVQYAFGIVNKDTCELEAGDVENDINNKFTDRKFYHDGVEIKMDESLGYYGQFNLMHTLKEMHPNVTVLISTGGWGASEGLWYATQNEASMRKFSASAVKFIRQYGFDGIDIDFEFPSETPMSGNYTEFTESIRSGIATRYAQFIRILSEDLAEASKADGKYYWLTSAVSASSWVLGGQTDSTFLDYLDFVSIMSYDYHGGWNNYVENQANIYPDPEDGETAQQAVKTLGFDWSYKFYRGKVQSEKILMGVPYYTRGWTNVSGGTTGLHGSSGTPLSNKTDNLNLWCDLDDNGNEVAAGANPLWHVMNVMKKDSNYKRYWDDVGKVPHIWNSTNNTFLTFEDEESIQERINYVKNKNLGGVLIWVMHGDYDYDAAKDEYVIGDTLTSKLYNAFEQAGPSQVTSDIDYTNSVLDFSVDTSGSKYDHPNNTYSIKVTNNSSVSLPSGFTFSFWLPKSSTFTSSWGGTATTKDASNDDFTEVILTANSGLEPGQTTEFTGMMKCCASALKNFKINGMSMASEVNEEIKRLNRSYITEANGGNGQSSEETTEQQTEKESESKTEEQTTATTDKHAATVDIDGFQISTTYEGFRTVYTVADPKNEVTEAGLIYGVDDYSEDSDMVIGSSNANVYSYVATEDGKVNIGRNNNTTQSYAMIMKFIKNAKFYSSKLCVRAYIKLNDGTYVYSNISKKSVYEIADQLYQGLKMTNYTGHYYLYENILKVVNPSYVEKDYDWSDALVKME